MSDEVKSAFYWRENMAPLEPNGCRRSKVSVKLLARDVTKLRDEGMTLTQIAARIGVTKRYVCVLLNKDSDD
jgi:hypothetical protein